MDEKEFIKIVSKIWKRIFTDTYVPIKIPKNKNTFLKNLFKKIYKHEYSPSNPREYIVSNKHNLVSRIVPVLSEEDILVYYYCTRKIEDNLSKTRVEWTYGWFSMWWETRKKEETEFNWLTEIPISISPYTYNPLAWVEAWRDFQKKAYTYSTSWGFNYFIKFDIANFYDSINLLLLEKKIREVSNKDEIIFIDLLFYFLKNWSKKFNNYFHKSVWLPQDEVWDCSRVLANFYLHDFDLYVSNFCKDNDMQYLRYADDMILMWNDEFLVKKWLFLSSKELSKIWLNINSSKVDIFKTTDEFKEYWAFDIFDKLWDKSNIKNIESAINDFNILNKKNIKFRKDSLISRFINCEINNVDITKKQLILWEVLNDEFLSNCESYTLEKIYKILSKNDKKLFQEKLDNLIDKIFFNKFHYSLLKISNLIKLNKKKINNKINELKF